jgi:hypothetical protein
MKSKVVAVAAFVCLGTTGCVAGPGGSYNAANRTIAGAAIGALLGGLGGSAIGDPLSGAAVGAVAGGGIGAVMNPKTFGDPSTRGYCYSVDAYGNPIMVPLDSVECKEAMARAGNQSTPQR